MTFRLLDDADGEAGDVVLADRVEAAHLSGLAANEGATGLFAGIRDALDDSGALLGVELADGEVVEDEERHRALDEDVVDENGNGVKADRVVNG